MNSFFCILILLLILTKVHNQLVNFDTNDNWKSRYHPFPEMSRFLNSYSRIHHESIRKTSASRATYSLREYICSIANKNDHIEEILLIFGEHYRSLIKTIIKHDCSIRKRNKRTTININENKFPRILYHNSRRKL